MPRLPGYRWNEAAGRYVNDAGRFVSRSEIRAAIDTTLRNIGREYGALAEQLRANTITAREWARTMRLLMKETHLWSAAAAGGGWAQLTRSDFGRIGQIVRGQYAYLENFAREIRRGLVLDGRFLRRVQLYAEAGRRTYHLVERARMLERGVTEERSVLHPADHCGECVDEAAKGWSPVSSIIPIGERTCLTGCHCTMEYR